MQKFEFIKSDLDGAYLIKPFYNEDIRGGFLKDFSIVDFKKNGLDYSLEETFYTISHKGVIRALHFQETNQQAKLVRCVKGKVFDVIVDLRPDSPTFKQWRSFILSDENHNEILVPEHFAHGYLVLEDSIVSYKCKIGFDKDNDSGIKFDDPDLNVDWPYDEIGGKENLILSDKDKQLQSFKEYFENGCK